MLQPVQMNTIIFSLLLRNGSDQSSLNLYSLTALGTFHKGGQEMVKTGGLCALLAAHLQVDMVLG